MKTKYKLFSILFSAIFVFSLTACAPNAGNDEQKIYISGEILAKNIIEYYFVASEQISYANSYQMELANLLASQDVDSEAFRSFSLMDNAEDRIKLFSEYIAVLEEMQKPEGPDKNPKQKIFNLLKILENQNICSEDTLKLLKDYIAANQFDMSVAVYETTSLMFGVWENDVLAWQKMLNKSYDEYVALVEQIPVDVFDEAKLTKFVYEPYKGKQTLVNIYKLNMKKEAFEQKANFLNKTVFLLNTFLDLKTLYFQFSNQNTDEGYLELSNTQIYNTLINFEENNKQNN